ncbi:RNA-directed DNA polymerase [Shewanella sp. 3B26]|uniref:RNA-directed DNA polymerase n=1 Tax=Shewanella zhuhaiensis TaxID=2919576 RepID=A0AAJ1EXB5_9GAMM|nr:RNA-directed DNA polymerase [Shewanella zhuhaiensis]
MFEDSSDMMVLRLDIASFFESINIGKVIERIKTDNILSRKSLEIIENTIKNLKISGLPRGLPISSPLSEIFMEEFDESIRSLDGIYYYSRYVDDIIIISTNSDKSIKSIITKKLKDIELEVNEKTEEKEISKSIETVTYLGYQYTLHPISESNKSNKRHVSVKMSKNKINKIKTRIVLSLINYNIKNESYKNKAIDNLHRLFRDRTLRNRIKFLSGNYEVRDNNQNKNDDDDEKTVLKGGLFYNNPLLNNIEQLEELNIFIRNLLFTNKNSLFGKRIRRIPIELRRELASTDFKHGFESRVTHQFFDFQLKEICEIWK